MEALPKLDLAKLKKEIKDIAHESHALKHQLRNLPHYSPYFESINTRVIELKRRATFLCSLRAAYGGRVHLMDRLEKYALARFELLQMLEPDQHLNRGKLVEEMFSLQDELLYSYSRGFEEFVVDQSSSAVSDELIQRMSEEEE